MLPFAHRDVWMVYCDIILIVVHSKTIKIRKKCYFRRIISFQVSKYEIKEKHAIKNDSVCVH